MGWTTIAAYAACFLGLVFIGEALVLSGNRYGNRGMLLASTLLFGLLSTAFYYFELKDNPYTGNHALVAIGVAGLPLLLAYAGARLILKTNSLQRQQLILLGSIAVLLPATPFLVMTWALIVACSIGGNCL